MAPLREAVGGDPRVMIVERHTLYRARTPTAITAFRRFAEQNAAPGRRVRVGGETDYGATAADLRGGAGAPGGANNEMAPGPGWGGWGVAAAGRAALLAAVSAAPP